VKIRPIDMLRASRGRVKVIIEVDAPVADEACLDRLRAHGVAIERVAENKVWGLVDPKRVDAVRADPQIAAIEESVPLRPHRS
jgi:hypothetical protein